ncbi:MULTISPECIES: hydroxyacylglutathione hydrolase [Asticcacaulis]|uniref:hydroxyacylglutathione hydrolase n=1 Tax=Asticcacaulis TaxID=76890 RepID=UPI001AE16905|nr:MULTISPECIES: hydroxyacylglutathione hydrolase [Asticcacaulis]MBP2157584.1 hydroxyacylglutathione hydrolase [Asticcacaulis solisilvae]MDR6798629.1 hydroxyacylglutathione hydrolase [Asticcacaulis sp. BE141]
MGLKITIFPCLTDNYGFLVKDEASGVVACIDTPEAGRIVAQAESMGVNIDVILNTHWHPDHGGGNAEVQARFGCPIFGPEEVRKRWPLDHVLKPGDVYQLGETRLDVIDLSGHTLGIIAYIDRAGGNAFVSDALFPLGCGRMFEGTPQAFWASLLRLCELPDDTVLWSAHEYTLANLKFAESLGSAGALTARAEKVRRQRERGEYTVPTTLAEEKATNPFLYYPLQENGFEAQAAKFAELRALKDNFR